MAHSAADLIEFLVRQGLVTREQVEECQAAQRALIAEGRSLLPNLVEVLVQRGFVTREQIRAALPVEALQAGRDAGTGVLLKPSVPLPPEVEAAMGDPERRFGKYVILREIGSAGVARVFLAWDRYLEDLVTLKRIRTSAPESDGEREEGVLNLIREARKAIKLRHPGIVIVHDVGRTNHEFYVSTEHVEGETLARRMAAARERGFLSLHHEDPEGAVRIACLMARALHYAHTRSIPVVHGDLKPDCVLIDRDGEPHVSDFGLGRSLKPRTAGTGAVASAPGDSPLPPADVRTDVHALGAILYELLTGRAPSGGESEEALRRAIADRPPLPGAGTPPAVPEHLEDLCMKCLEKDRELRPHSMAAIADALERDEGGDQET